MAEIQVVIRDALASEANVLSELAIRSKAYWGYSRGFMAACRDELSYDPEQIDDAECGSFVAEWDDRIVGFYAAIPLSSTEYELDALFVDPDFIGCGIGRKLVEHAKAWVRRRGGGSLVIQGDPNATAFYLAVGGIQIGKRESDSIPGRYLPLFRISLNAECLEPDGGK